MTWYHFSFLLVVLWLTGVIIPCYGVQLCAQGHIFLVSNGTDGGGTTLTYTNTLTQELHNIAFDGHYLPPSSVCGVRNGRCAMSTLFSRDGTILVAAVPFGDGVGLVSYQFDNISMIYREKVFLSYNTSCVPAFFLPITDPLQPLYGYCLALSTQVIENFVVNVNFERLNTSRVDPAFNFPTFTFQSNSLLSNFVFFPEILHICFSNVDGHTVFLQNSNIVYHSISIREYYSDTGSINVPACSSSEPRLQRLGTECKLAAYCNQTAALFDAPESGFGEVTHFSGDVFLCSSNFYVRFMNNSLSVHRVSNDEQISGFIALDAETILLGDCLFSETQFYFIAALNDARTIFVNFTSNLPILLLRENADPILLPYAIVNDLLFVNNETHSLVINWTRISVCPEDVLTVPTNFNLVHSFSDQSLSEECGCVQDMVTTTTAIDTTTNQMESTTFTMSTTETTSSVTIERPTISLSPISGLSAGGIAGISIAIALMMAFLIILFLTTIGYRVSSRRLGGRDFHPPLAPASCRNDKSKLIEETKQNNIDDVNNVELSGQETEPPVQENPPAPAPSPTPPPSTPIGVEELQRDQGQKVVLYIPTSSSVANASPNNKEEYPINTNAVSQPTSPSRVRRNDSQLVTGSDPREFSAQASVNQNGASTTNPSAATTSPNPDPLLTDNRVTEVMTNHLDASNDQQCSCDLVAPELKPTVLPNRQSLSDNVHQSEACSCYNTPNGIIPHPHHHGLYGVHY